MLLIGSEIPFTSMEPHLFYGWDNVARHPLLNVMLSFPSWDVFLVAIDTTWNKRVPITITYVMFWLK
jgi:hypothetical protein